MTRAGAVAFALVAAYLLPIGIVRAQAGSGAGPRGATDAASGIEAVSPLARLLRDARRLLDNGQPQAAYDLLQPSLALYAGDTGFDFLLGVSALDTARPGEAILALERVLAQQPNNLQARAEIARAYLAVKETESARREFEAVAAQELPPEVRAIVGRYLQTIDRVAASERVKSQFFVDVTVGHDDNVNLGSSLGQWLLSDGTQVIPLAISRPQSSAVFGVGGGGSMVIPIGGGWQWTVGGQVSHRSNPSAHTLDTTSLDLSTSVTLRTGCNAYTMGALYQNLRLDGSSFRDAAGVLAQWQCDLSERTQVGGYFQHFDFDFPDQSGRDARRDTIGATVAHAFTGSRAPVAIGAVHGGKEKARNGTPQLGYGFVGVRAALNAAISPGWRGFASLSYEKRDFDGEEPLFGNTRADRQTEIRIGVDYEASREWTLSPQIIHTKNRSTLGPNDFQRLQALLLARYRF